MCDFISWIEHDGTLYYLTDKEIFSSEGKKIFKDCKDNDVLGHGAIRLYYSLKDKGTNHEVRDFWNTDQLPLELRDKVKNFDSNWGRTWRSGCFQNDDLGYIIKYAPDKWREKAWTQLQTQSPSNYDLRYIITYAPDRWKEKARQILAKNNL